MSTQIGAPWFSNLRRRTVRAEVNPLDKCTVVSIYPVEVNEVKPTIYPGRFKIPAGTYAKPSILVVGSSSWWRELGEDEPLLEIPQSSILVADSIVKDYANGLLECNMQDLMPGLFYIPGEKTVVDVLTKHKKELDIANTKQNAWYKALVTMGDILWSRSSGNPLSISNDMRIAARDLGLKKDWDQDFARLEMIKCKACSTMNQAGVIVCPNCKVILDPVKFKELGLSFAS